MIKNGVGMIKKWMVKFGQSNVSLQKIIKIHPFFGQTKTHNDLDER
jgi:hypothetical protein